MSASNSYVLNEYFSHIVSCVTGLCCYLFVVVIISHRTGIILVSDVPGYAPASLDFAYLINKLIYYYNRDGCEEFEIFNYIVSYIMLHDQMIA